MATPVTLLIAQTYRRGKTRQRLKQYALVELGKILMPRLDFANRAG